MKQFNLLKNIPCRRCGGKLVSIWHRHWKSGDGLTKGDDTLTDQQDITCKGGICEIKQPLKPRRKKTIMGKYINPREGDKETWLLEHGEVLDYIPETFENEIGDKLAVCLVVNVGFTAAAIAVDQRELEAFKDLRDLRPKLWFWVPKTALTPFL